MVATSNYDAQNQSIAVDSSASVSYSSTGTAHESLLDRVEDAGAETLKICGIAWHIFTIGACISAIILTLVALIVAFTIQTPTVSVVSVYARSIPANETGVIPLNVVLSVDNPNIIGATISSPLLTIYNGTGAVLGTGTVDETDFDARATTNVTVNLTLPVSDALVQFLHDITSGSNDTVVTVVAQVEIYLGALHPQFTITETKTVPPYSPDQSSLYLDSPTESIPEAESESEPQGESELPVITRMSKPFNTLHQAGKTIFKN